MGIKFERTINSVVRPEFIKDKYLFFLYALRESGKMNMWGAPAVLRRKFPDLTEKQSYDIFDYWAHNLEEGK